MTEQAAGEGGGGRVYMYKASAAAAAAAAAGSSGKYRAESNHSALYLHSSSNVHSALLSQTVHKNEMSALQWSSYGKERRIPCSQNFA